MLLLHLGNGNAVKVKLKDEISVVEHVTLMDEGRASRQFTQSGQLHFSSFGRGGALQRGFLLELSSINCKHKHNDHYLNAHSSSCIRSTKVKVTNRRQGASRMWPG